MIDELKKSFQYVINERIASPLSGALIISWLAWNWKILYLLFWGTGFESTEKLLSFISDNHCDIYYNAIYPFASAILIVALYPILTTSALWITLKYKFKQNEIKNKIEKNKLLTLEQSIQLRTEMEEVKTKYFKMVLDKDIELDKTKKQLEDALKNGKVAYEQSLIPEEDYETENVDYEISTFKYPIEFRQIVENITVGRQLLSGINNLESLSYFVALNLIENNDKLGNYILTEKGKMFARRIIHNS